MADLRTLALCLALVSGALFAQSLLTGVSSGMNSLCASIQDLMPVVAMLMVVLAGVLYAAGQVMGAETRARGNVWATAALTGALVAVLIIVVSPPVLGAVAGQSISCTASPSGPALPQTIGDGVLCTAPVGCICDCGSGNTPTCSQNQHCSQNLNSDTCECV